MQWRALATGVSLLALVAAWACGPLVMLPPRIDLRAYEIIGLVEFAAPEAGPLGRLATRRFLEAAHRDQGTVQIVDLGTEARLLDELGRSRLDQDAFRLLGTDRRLRTVIVGELAVSDVRPDIHVAPGFRYGRIGAEVEATLSTRMVATATGAAIWSSTSTAEHRVAGVSIFGGDRFGFDAEDPDDAYGDLVGVLVERVTRDFRVTWTR